MAITVLHGAIKWKISILGSCNLGLWQDRFLHNLVANVCFIKIRSKLSTMFTTHFYETDVSLMRNFKNRNLVKFILVIWVKR